MMLLVARAPRFKLAFVGFLLCTTTEVITVVEHLQGLGCGVCACAWERDREREESREIMDPSHFLKYKYNAIVLIEISKAKLWICEYGHFMCE